MIGKSPPYREIKVPPPPSPPPEVCRNNTDTCLSLGPENDSFFDAGLECNADVSESQNRSLSPALRRPHRATTPIGEETESELNTLTGDLQATPCNHAHSQDRSLSLAMCRILHAPTPIGEETATSEACRNGTDTCPIVPERDSLSGETDRNWHRRPHQNSEPRPPRCATTGRTHLQGSASSGQIQSRPNRRVELPLERKRGMSATTTLPTTYNSGASQ